MIFPFLVSFLSFAHINLVGEFYISEVMLLGYLIFSAGKLRLLAAPFPKKLLLLGLLWLLSQMVTDWYRDSIPENYLRGWAAIIFFLIDFCAVYLMVRQKPDVIRTLILGTALGTIFSVIFFPTDYSISEPWKFGYGFPVTLLVLLYLSTGNRYKTKAGLLLLVALGVLGVFMNARSLGGMAILTAAILYLGQRRGFQANANKRPNPIKLAWLGLGVLLAVYGIKSVYEWSAESGYLPEKVAEKYLMGKGKDTGLLGVIAGGRPEILISSQAVMDSPILGHGSWAENPYYTSMRYEAVAKLGLEVDESFIKYSIESSDLIPTHSSLMQAWVWAGLLGAVFWLFVGYFLITSILCVFFNASGYQVLVIYLCILGLWNVLFSPFGGGDRFDWALALVVIYFGTNLLNLSSGNQVINFRNGEHEKLFFKAQK